MILKLQLNKAFYHHAYVEDNKKGQVKNPTSLYHQAIPGCEDHASDPLDMFP